MIVTDIVEVTKTRSKVFIDGSFAFVLYKGELRKYSLKEGEEIELAAYRELTETVLPKRAKLRCMNLLQSREYTEKQLKDKLRQGGYPESMIEVAVEYVKSYRYVDDDRYASDYIECHIDKKSRQRITQDLLQKGISRECIERQWQKLDCLGVKGDEEKIIREILEKKHYAEKKEDRKEQQRIYAFLLRRGFPADLIRKTMNTDIL